MPTDQKRSAELIAADYARLTDAALAAAEENNGVVPAHIDEALDALVAEFGDSVDRCAAAYQHEQAEIAAEDARVKFYADLAAKHRVRRGHREDGAARIRAKLMALAEASGGVATGEQYTARVQLGVWSAKPDVEGAQVPEAALVPQPPKPDLRKLCELARAGQAPGWRAEQAKILKIR